MVFLRPYWFLALIPLAFLLGWLWRRRTGASIWSGLVDAHLLPHLLVTGSERSARWPLALLGGGWLILVVALAGPMLVGRSRRGGVDTAYVCRGWVCEAPTTDAEVLAAQLRVRV